MQCHTIENPVSLLLALVTMNTHCWPSKEMKVQKKHLVC